jgi:hypothetical protein
MRVFHIKIRKSIRYPGADPEFSLQWGRGFDSVKKIQP